MIANIEIKVARSSQNLLIILSYILAAQTTAD